MATASAPTAGASRIRGLGFTALLLAAALAGCTQAPPSGVAVQGDVGAKENPPGDDTEAATPSPTTPAGAAAQLLSLDACAGITTMTPLPESLVGAEPLPGWRGSPTTLAEIHLDGYVCERAAIDRFERGPIGLAFEFYAANGGPDGCLEGSWTTSEVLHALWVSDPEVAAHLAGLGLPARLATFDLATTSNGPVLQTRLTIAAAAGGIADLQTQSLAEAGETLTSDHTYRYLWSSPDGGMGYMDFGVEWHSDPNAPPVVAATMPSPFLASRSGSDVLLGYGTGVVETTGRAPFHLFKDPECEQPL